MDAHPQYRICLGPKSEKGTLRFPFVASIVIDPRVVTSWSPSNRGSSEYSVLVLARTKIGYSEVNMQSMRILAKKEELLESQGYKYNFRRQLYFSPSSKKAFSVPFLQDCSLEELECHIAEDKADADWQFFFSLGQQPSDTLRRELVTVLG